MSRCRHGRSMFERGPCPLCESEYRIDELQSELAREREKQERDREERRREIREAARQAQCEAETWEEAFAKGTARVHNEIVMFGGDEGHVPSFEPLLKTWDAAWKIYNDEMSKARVEILARIASRVEAELVGQEGVQELAEALRADNHLYLVDW